MGKIVKQSGTRALNNKRQTVHGSKPKARLTSLGGKAMGADKKPSGFLSKKPRP